jgi:hypothetical protein
LALKACERVGLQIEWNTLTSCPALKAFAEVAPVEHALIQVLGGSPLEGTSRERLKATLAGLKWTLDDVQEAEQVVRALIVARLLDPSLLATMESAMLTIIAQKQVTQGKEAGSCPLDATQPVGASARAYVLLGVGRARWAALTS